MTTDTKATATPIQMIEAWELGVMGGGWLEGGRRDFERHPPTIPDPTYYRDEGGWSSASNITNPSAIRKMQGFLAHRGLVAPPETEAAWVVNLRRKVMQDKVEEAVHDALRKTSKTAERLEDYTTAVRQALSELEAAE